MKKAVLSAFIIGLTVSSWAIQQGDIPRTTEMLTASQTTALVDDLSGVTDVPTAQDNLGIVNLTSAELLMTGKVKAWTPTGLWHLEDNSGTGSGDVDAWPGWWNMATGTTPGSYASAEVVGYVDEGAQLKHLGFGADTDSFDFSKPVDITVHFAIRSSGAVDGSFVFIVGQFASTNTPLTTKSVGFKVENYELKLMAYDSSHTESSTGYALTDEVPYILRMHIEGGEMTSQLYSFVSGDIDSSSLDISGAPSSNVGSTHIYMASRNGTDTTATSAQVYQIVTGVDL